MPSEDITWCMRDCKYTKCRRNQKNIKLMIMHSFADLKDTEDCYEKYPTKENEFPK